MVALETTEFWGFFAAKVAVTLLYIAKCFWRWCQTPVQPASRVFFALCRAWASVSAAAGNKLGKRTMKCRTKQRQNHSNQGPDMPQSAAQSSGAVREVEVRG